VSATVLIQGADRILDILIEECGAHPALRPEFQQFASGNRPTEFRFIGSLGFGGKFWNYAGRWYVNCYPEDKTIERIDAIEKANKRLSRLHDDVGIRDYYDRCHREGRNSGD
jgi:hypothetical protein